MTHRNKRHIFFIFSKPSHWMMWIRRICIIICTPYNAEYSMHRSTLVSSVDCRATVKFSLFHFFFCRQLPFCVTFPCFLLILKTCLYNIDQYRRLSNDMVCLCVYTPRMVCVSLLPTMLFIIYILYNILLYDDERIIICCYLNDTIFLTLFFDSKFSLSFAACLYVSNIESNIDDGFHKDIQKYFFSLFSLAAMWRYLKTKPI